ncbi:hypothetical protein ACFC36_15985 [Streptomyces rubiginosohelvolus]|uniref:hypothetical protein n=1 Tax=Streptomyces rubiginosohelvolus TaxID=67362 RepID=UPI0035DFEA87
MELQVTVLICDVCKERDVPAKKYLLAIGESEPKRRDLCDRDAAPVLAAFGLPAEPVTEMAPGPDQPPTGAGAAATPAKKAAPRKAAAKKATAKKTVAKKTAVKKTAAKKTLGARTMTLAEIEAEKAKAAAGTS